MIVIRPEDIARLKATMKSKPTGFNRCRSLLMHMFNTPIECGKLKETPVLTIKRYKEESRERLLTADELNRLGDSLEKAKATEM